MGKILVRIYIPVIGETYDIFIPLASKMHEVLSLVKNAVEELSDGRFLANDNTVICFKDDGGIININLSVGDLNIINGTELMLI